MPDEVEHAPTDTQRHVETRSGGMKGGHDPRELARKSAESRRAKRAQAQAEARNDALTTQARLALAVADRLGYADIVRLLDDLKERAHGTGHVANAATQQLLALASAALAYEPEADEATPDEALTPAQRATRRATLERIIREYEESGEESEDRAEAGAD